MAEWRRPPITVADFVATVLIYTVACLAAWTLAGLVPDYRTLFPPDADTRYLPLAYAVAWLGIGLTLLIIPLWMIHAIRLRRRAWTTAIVAFPLLAEAWVLGLLTAIVAVPP
ncbi:hypothetical protein [Nocardia seriolae]|uniref:Uncharacterized protein n=1 Tax=Nocardia seriolae TaxID=37332 RepID=A0ABC8AJI2_9NOCA|nr:hypothetical protein [Nocardia seriolae]APA94548.1 hypothetical protein NS506_00466 [Nocardia seriolae]MTJ66870.1 hypothetical protein [Nocardia seriolae]MTJ72527.1 hypothetical protein [Nocardia seriolae]MTJ84853.1 hypothetical protein [Nocardia seriolae]MTK28849.1 hypothetical protein [Nocardia seriolae]